MQRTASACGKIILCGEYAVVFGYAGIAVPAKERVNVSFETGKENEIEWPVTSDKQQVTQKWITYAKDILKRCTTETGTLTIDSNIPLGKGMGASTALVIAIAKCVLGEHCKEQALAIEDAVNPGHSGIDFAVIWEERPLLYRKGEEPQVIQLPEGILDTAELIDSGAPNETTAELVAWVRSRSGETEIRNALEVIGNCTQRLLNGEPLAQVIQDHNKAQCILGIVTDKTKSMITKIEQEGGSAKVIGAGGRSGGSGMVLILRNT